MTRSDWYGVGGVLCALSALGAIWLAAWIMAFHAAPWMLLPFTITAVVVMVCLIIMTFKLFRAAVKAAEED